MRADSRLEPWTSEFQVADLVFFNDINPKGIMGQHVLNSLGL